MRLAALVLVCVGTLLAGGWWLRQNTDALVTRLSRSEPRVPVGLAARQIRPESARRMGVPFAPIDRGAPWANAADVAGASEPAFVEELPPVFGEAAVIANEAHAASADGDLETAVELLLEALELEPDHPLLLRNLQVTYLNQATALLNHEDWAGAIPILEGADALGAHPLVLRALGIAYHRTERERDAAVVLEMALALRPGDGTTLAILAEVYAALDRRAEALDLVLRARDAGAADPNLNVLAERLAREVDAEWDYVRSETDHFLIDYDEGPAAEVVADVAAALEAAHAEVGAMFDYFPEGKTRAVIYPDSDFHSVTKMPDWIGGIFDGRIKVPARGFDTAGTELSRVLRHEYAHRLIAEIAGHACPIWLNEGISMWAEGDPEFRHEWAMSQLAGQHLLDLNAIRGPLASLGKRAAQIAYAQSYLAVEHLSERYGPRSVADFLKEVGIRRDVSEASRLVFRADLAVILDRYFTSLAEP